MLRIVAALALALMTSALLPAPPLEWGSAHAQVKPVKKKAAKRSPPPKPAPQQQEERAPFTLEEQEAAAIPGIPDARVWGDSAKDFARLLPQASGPWLAISGGGSDGAFGGGGRSRYPGCDRRSGRRCLTGDPPCRP